MLVHHDQNAKAARVELIELLNFFAQTYEDVFGITEGPPLHDPLAVAVILDGIPGVEVPFVDGDGINIKKERFEVKVVTEGTHDEALKGAETGKTVVQLLLDGEEGIRIPRGLNIPRFWSVLEECLQRADDANKRTSNQPL